MSVITKADVVRRALFLHGIGGSSIELSLQEGGLL